MGRKKITESGKQVVLEETLSPPVLPRRPFPLVLLLVPFLVAALMLLYNQYSQPQRPTRKLVSAAQIGSGIVGIMTLIGTVCACCLKARTGCPSHPCAIVMVGWLILGINSVTSGMCGILWMGLTICRR